MSAFVSSVAATIITIPIIGYVILFIISKQITKKHRKAVHIAIDGSMLLFIISVHYLIVTIWEKSFLWLILLLIILNGMTVVIINWKVKQEIDFQRVFRGFWRVNFLVFFSAYIILLLIGIVISIAASIS